MKVYFYHTQDVQRIVREWGDGRFPGHFLYGALSLGELGHEVVWHRHKACASRLKTMFYVAWRVLTCRERYDALYATHYQGLELIVLLRALGLYRHPIVMWIHQPLPTGRGLLRRLAGRLFHRGMDHMMFFSDKILRDSLRSPCAIRDRMHVAHWGADLDFYDRLMQAEGTEGRHGAISTGKELRDMPTLIEGGVLSGAELTICLPTTFAIASHGVTRHGLVERYGWRPGGNVGIELVDGLIPYELAQMVNRSACVAVCCYESNYTAGLTTAVEALALGLPMVISRNAQMPFDVDDEGCGISVPYGDVEGWSRALHYMATHPDEAQAMGRRARRLADTTFNDRACAADADHLLRMCFAGRRQ